MEPLLYPMAVATAAEARTGLMNAHAETSIDVSMCYGARARYGSQSIHTAGSI